MRQNRPAISGQNSLALTVDRVQSAYGDKYDYLMMYDSKRDVADILHEETEARSIREHLRQKQQAQQKQNKKNSRDTWER